MMKNLYLLLLLNIGECLFRRNNSRLKKKKKSSGRELDKGSFFGRCKTFKKTCSALIIHIVGAFSTTKQQYFMCCAVPCFSKMATACAKPSKQSRAKLDSFVTALNKKGIKLLALDFDKTLIDIHSGGMWNDGADKLASHVRPCMRDLLEAASNKGLFVAIVTYHRQGWLIKEVLHKVLPKK